MPMPSSRVRVYACLEPIDMRKSFSGLSGAVRTIMSQDPLSGHVFLFFNERRNYVKMLWWDRTGYCVVAKKLVRGTFGSVSKSMLSPAEVVQVLEGLDISSSKEFSLWEYLPA